MNQITNSVSKSLRLRDTKMFFILIWGPCRTLPVTWVSGGNQESGSDPRSGYFMILHVSHSDIGVLEIRTLLLQVFVVCGDGNKLQKKQKKVTFNRSTKTKKRKVTGYISQGTRSGWG